MRLLEKQIEDVFEKFYQDLIEPNLKLKGRQVTLKNKRRIDLLFIDENNKDVILELKRDKVTDKDVGQIVSYAGTISNSRVILAAPKIDKSYKKSFEHYGIEYIEFSITKIQKLFSQLSREENKNKKTSFPILKEIIKEPLSQKRIIDGNIAFKVSFNDKNWSGICSHDTYKENSFGKHKMFWCNAQHNSNNTVVCQKWNDDELDVDNYPCCDCVANKILGFTPAWNHGQNKPHVCLNAKVNKIAFLTSLEPGERQSERFIFTIFQIDRIKIKKDENDIEYYYGNQSTAIKLSPDQYLKFWNYYKNSSSKSNFKTFWGSGLFRYINDKVANEVLSDIIKRHGFTKKQKRNAEVLLSKLINE